MRVFGRLIWRPTLRRRLILTVAGVHFVLMMVFVSDLTGRQQQFILERGREHARFQADFLATSVAQQMVTRDYAGLQDLVSSTGADDTVNFAFVSDEAGKIVAHSDVSLVGRYFNDERARAVLTGPPRPSLIYVNERFVHAVAPVRMEGVVVGWTWVAKDLSSGLAALHEVRVRGLQYLLMAVVIGAASALLIAHGITRQLRALTAGAQRLVQKKLDTPVPILSDDEVGDVAVAFNTAMREISEYQAERSRAQAELQRANEALIAANDSLGQFAYAASHDLQEPLRAVASYSELLARKYKGKLDHEADTFLGFIHTGAVRMQHLVVALLEYSRAGARADAPTEVVDCRKALDAALENLKIALESSAAQVEVAGQLGRVNAHEVAVSQLFQNLVGNALKYSSEAPRIRIWSEPDGQYLCFAVQDNGIGITPADRERVFTIFKRAHGDKFSGTGVGLAICRKLVERYGGRIWVESEPGKGSTFRFTLPASSK